MLRLLFVLAFIAVGNSLSSVVMGQANYHAYYYGYDLPSDTHWVPFAEGDSLGTSVNQGHITPTTEGFPPVAYSCTDTWYQHAGQQAGMWAGICTVVDDDGDWYRYIYWSPPDVWEGTISCIGGTGKYEGLECEATYRGQSLAGSGWFRGEIEGTMTLK